MVTNHQEIDWLTGFKLGEVVWSLVGAPLGVVLSVVRRGGASTWWELHVDAIERSVARSPESSHPGRDEASGEEARRLGLRSLHSFSRFVIR